VETLTRVALIIPVPVTTTTPTQTRNPLAIRAIRNPQAIRAKRNPVTSPVPKIPVPVQNILDLDPKTPTPAPRILLIVKSPMRKKSEPCTSPR